MPLYHYTCSHAHRLIGDDGLLRPAIAVATPAQRRALRGNPYSARTAQVVWLTTMPNLTWLNRQAAGLGMDGALAAGKRRRSPNPPRACDRTRYRWAVTDEDALIEPWTDLRQFWPRWLVIDLERLPGALPATWWCSRGPLRAVYSPHRTDLDTPVPA